MNDHKTTITGLFVAILMAIQPYVESGEFDIKKNWAQYLIAVGVAIFGYLSKSIELKKINV